MCLEPSHLATTAAHLGNISLVTHSRLAWDAVGERIKDNPAANALLARDYRAPWCLPKAVA